MEKSSIHNYNKLFKEIKFLGEGAYGKVFLAENLSVPGIPISKLVAVKLIDISKANKKDIDRINKELQVLQTLSATGCTKGVLCYYTNLLVNKNNTIYQAIITEYLQGEPLNDVIDNIETAGTGNYNINNFLNNKKLKNIIGYLLETLEIIHSTNIVHRDIKPDNIFVLANGMKYIDFGLSCILNNCPNYALGTPFYMDPNLKNLLDLTNKDNYPPGLTKESLNTQNIEILKKADIWSLGITLYEFLYGHLPLGDDYDSIQDYFYDITHIPFNFGSSIFDPLLEKMLEKNITLRPNIEQLLSILDKINVDS